MNNDSHESVLPTDTGEDKKGAGVKFPPPLIFLLSLFTGIGLNWLWPASLGIPSPFNLLGLIPVGFSIAIMIVISLSFRRVQTAIEPWKPTTSMIYSGFYEYSRNPIYLGFCLCLIGLGISANNLWIVINALPCGILIYYIAIKKEEAYLAKKFGEDYLSYKSRVRRWI